MDKKGLLTLKTFAILFSLYFLFIGCAHLSPLSREWPTNQTEGTFFLEINRYLNEFEKDNQNLVYWLSLGVEFDHIKSGPFFAKKRDVLEVFLNIDEYKHHFKIPHQRILVDRIELTEENAAELGKKVSKKITDVYLKFVQKEVKRGHLSYPAPEQLWVWQMFSSYAGKTILSDFTTFHFYGKNFKYSVPEKIKIGNKDYLAIELIYWTSDGVIVKRFKIKIPKDFSSSSSEINNLGIEAQDAAFGVYFFISEIINRDIKNKILTPQPG